MATRLIRDTDPSDSIIAPDPTGKHRVWLLAVALAFCLAVLFRFELLNGFSVLQGDRFDGVIVSVILEHWFHVFTRGENWVEVGYFFPYTRTIAQTDGYFLIGLAYLPFRLLGFDAFLATDLANMLIKSCGFFGMYLLCRQAFSLRFFWAMLAAMLFTLNNGMTIHSWRIQLASIAFAPVLGLMLWHMGRAFAEGQRARFLKWGVLAALLYGAWCMTCFYMAWFFVLFFAFFVVALLIVGGRPGLALLRRRCIEQYGSILLIGAVAMLSLIPFLYAFLPKSNEVGVRAYSEVLPYLVSLTGVLQVGQNNLLVGPLYNQVVAGLQNDGSTAGEYSNTGFNVVLFLFFLASSVAILRRPAKGAIGLVLKATVLATLVTLPLTLNIFGNSGWFVVYHLFPGAKALRVVAIYQIFLALPVVLIAVHFLSKLGMRFGLALPVVALLVAAEFNTPYLSMNRNDELKRIALPEAAPAACRVFYTSGWKGVDSTEPASANYAHNVTAMFIAQRTGIPTINGMASFNPPDWNFAFPNRADYDERVMTYAFNHHITGLCRLDLESKHWTQVEVKLPKQRRQVATVTFNRSPQPPDIREIKGLSAVEPWGAWSDGKQVSIEFAQPLPEHVYIRLTGQAFGPNVGKEFIARVGDSTARFTLMANSDSTILEFENPKKSNTLIIEVPVPTSPKMLAQGTDPRMLGVGLMELVIFEN